MQQTKPEIVVRSWDNRLLEQAGRLYAGEYGGTSEHHIERFRAIYDHEFQRGRALRLVATQGDELVGIQSLFYWPYRRGNHTFHVLQSGNSIIAPQCRGMGLFGRMLKAQDTILDDLPEVDWLIGFPVKASRNSFLRNGWQALEDLTWRLAVVNPVAPAFRKSLPAIESFLAHHGGNAMYADCYNDKFRIAGCAEFDEWRSGMRAGEECVIGVEIERNVTTFRVKVETRHRVPVIVIGDVVSTSRDENVLKRAFQRLFSICRQAGCGFVAICHNSAAETEINCVIERLFRFRLKNKVHVIVKPVQSAAKGLANRGAWVLYRGDVDTW